MLCRIYNKLRPKPMSEIYRVPPWLMLEHWELDYQPFDKPNTFAITIFDSDYSACVGKGVSISHAAKNAYKNRQRKLNETRISSEGSASPSENKAEENQPTKT